KGMDDKVLYFSDRPVRKAGFITVTQFMDNWSKGDDSFKKTPPNAAIVQAALYPSDKGRSQALAVELTNPTNTANDWTFDIKVMGGGRLEAAELSNVSVFVDGVDGAEVFPRARETHMKVGMSDYYYVYNE
ncbi:MAG: hypothetical protein NTY13_06290, partial [Chlamydiae bacterium]|nr:hypothetical protein [Chlamydiota bacterium]